MFPENVSSQVQANGAKFVDGGSGHKAGRTRDFLPRVTRLAAMAAKTAGV